MQFPNVVLPGAGPMKYETVGPALAQSVVTWADLAWIRDLWGGPIVVKGILTGDDARRAADHGVDAVIVSNHGGRQLDGVAAGLRALPEVVAAAGSTDRSADGRRHPTRQRHREGAVPRRERRCWSVARTPTVWLRPASRG